MPNWRFISIPVLQLPIFSVIISLSFICHLSWTILVRIQRVFAAHIILVVAGAADNAPEQLSCIPTIGISVERRECLVKWLSIAEAIPDGIPILVLLADHLSANNVDEEVVQDNINSYGMK